jgi:hypothetical protein
VELLGENGLLKQMTKAVLERAPAEEAPTTWSTTSAIRPGVDRVTAARDAAETAGDRRCQHLS